MRGKHPNKIHSVRLQRQEAQTWGRQSLEVDLIVGNLDLAIEYKATTQVDERHTKGLRAQQEDQRVKSALIVSLDSTPRQLSSGITVYPWQVFCQKLWGGEFAV